MSSVLLCWLLLYGLLACLRGSWRLRQELTSSPGKEALELQRILTSSVFFSGAFIFAFLTPLWLSDAVGWFAHTHSPQGDILHRFISSASAIEVQGVCLALLVGYLLWAWVPSWRMCFRLRRWERRLQSMSVQQNESEGLPEGCEQIFGGPIRWVPGSWAGLVGAYRPTLYIGMDLLEALSKEELSALLAHEEAHRIRRDTHYRFVLTFLCKLLPFVGPRLFAAWSDRAEESCDQFAARHVEDPLVVASALLKTSRLQRKALAESPTILHRQGSPVATGFAQHSCLEKRIEALLSLSQTSPLLLTDVPFLSMLIRCALLVFLLQLPLHHAIEFIVSWLY